MGFSCPSLTSRNYTTWKDIAWSRLIEKGYSLYVDGTITKPTDAKPLIDWQNLDRQALGVIKSCVHGDLLFTLKLV